MDIAESFCTLVLELLEYGKNVLHCFVVVVVFLIFALQDDIVDDLKTPSLKLEEIVQNVHKMFHSNEVCYVSH